MFFVFKGKCSKLWVFCVKMLKMCFPFVFKKLNVFVCKNAQKSGFFFVFKKIVVFKGENAPNCVISSLFKK